MQNYLMVGQCCVQLSKVGQCCVQLSNGWIVLCPIFQWLDSVVYNCPMVRQCCVQLLNGRTVLCPIVQWLDSAVSNCPMVGQCCMRGSTQREALATQGEKSIPHVKLINNFFFSKGKIKSSICFGKLPM